jgi:hypothetical protein
MLPVQTLNLLLIQSLKFSFDVLLVTAPVVCCHPDTKTNREYQYDRARCQIHWDGSAL